MEILNNNIKLKVKNLTKKMDDKVVLNNISFNVYEGEFLSILGLSGCGKTTLLRILIGLEKQSAGTIHKGSKEISNLECSKRGMGIVFQNYALFPNMTVLQNVEYGMQIQKKSKNEAHEIALMTLDQLGMMEQLDKRPNQLSGGQQQRVAIARTLALKPDLILLDEPISALDVTNREIMKQELKRIQKQFNSTMVYVTHEQEEAFYLSDRIMVMKDGNIEQIDTPVNLFHHPKTKYIEEFVIEHLEKKYQSLMKCTGRSL